ncbi:MAG TPA: ADP-ribosyltransferase, partial [Jatrophihabitantaceae bacterium]|nr:ADP-ribosyltransferase [Jatrophihabitantaceae bacterium]
ILVVIAFPAALAAFAATDGLLAGLAAGGSVLVTAGFGGAMGTAMTATGLASLGTETALYAEGEGDAKHLAFDAALTLGPTALVKGAQYLKDVTADVSAFRGYTGSGNFSELNLLLRNGDAGMDSDRVVKLDRLSANLSAALRKLPSYEGFTYRGADLPPDVAASYKPGQTVTEQAFVSSSTEVPFPGNTQFTIRSTSGKDVSSRSVFPGEKEILFDKRSQFRVLANDVESGVHYIVMEQLK